MQSLIEIIGEAAAIPSFSSYEERIHPFLLDALQGISGADYKIVEDRNVVAYISGDSSKKPVALTAHLDKINHFGKEYPSALPVEYGSSYIKGQLDNTVGIGIILRLAQIASLHDWPPLLVMFSEMEESFGLKYHPELLRNNGEGLYHGMGAERIARDILDRNITPQAVITVDTTPLFKGERGVAFYSGHWEFTEQQPNDEELRLTEELKDLFRQIDPELLFANNTNDYLTYGKIFNQPNLPAVPSVAIEPAIFPYHQLDEQVYFDDIERVYNLLKTYLSEYS